MLSELKRLRQEVNTLRNESKRQKTAGGSDESKGQGKGRGRGGGRGGKGGRGLERLMPSELRGKTPTTAAGERICWSYNMKKGCSNAPDGGRCSHGMHVCCQPGCEQPHPLTQHR